MPRKLTNANISFVSLVDKGANGKQFAIIKNDGGKHTPAGKVIMNKADAPAPNFGKAVTLIRKDDDKRLVTGIVYEPDTVDSHGDYMTAEDIEKAAHLFMEEYQQIDKQHNYTDGYGTVVESFVAKSEMTIGEQVVKAGTWVMTVKVADDETWEAVKKGEITGFSMGGIAEVETVDDVAKSEAGLLAKITKALAGALGMETVEKGAVRDRYNVDTKRRNFWQAWDSFESTLRRYNWATDSYEFESDETKIREALTDLNEILTEILLTDNVAKALGQPPATIEKAGKAISAANMDKIRTAHNALAELVALADNGEKDGEGEMTPEQLQEILNKALDPINKRLDEIEKGGDPAPAATEPQADDVEKKLGEVLEKALAPITDRLDKIEKSRQVPQSLEAGSGGEQQPVQKSVFSTLFEK